MNRDKTLRIGRFVIGVAGILTAAFSLSADQSLTLIPSSSLSGPPGSTVGWGFTITNDSGYIEITSSQFCENPVNFPLVCSSPTTGSYNDFISTYSDVIVGPPGGTEPDSVSQSFDPVGLTGVGSFDINPGASVGNSDNGEIVLTYNLSDLDPNDPSYDPSVDLLATDLQLEASADITVSAPSGPPGVPEPGTGWLFLGVAGLWMGRVVMNSRRTRNRCDSGSGSLLLRSL